MNYSYFFFQILFPKHIATLLAMQTHLNILGDRQFQLTGLYFVNPPAIKLSVEIHTSVILVAIEVG